jgi:hypothetical protein
VVHIFFATSSYFAFTIKYRKYVFSFFGQPAQPSSRLPHLQTKSRDDAIGSLRLKRIFLEDLTIFCEMSNISHPAVYNFGHQKGDCHEASYPLVS